MQWYLVLKNLLTTASTLWPFCTDELLSGPNFLYSMEGGMNLAVGGNTTALPGSSVDPNGPSRSTQNTLAAAAAYAAASAAACDPSSSTTGSGSPWYGPPASPSPAGAPHTPLDITQLKGLSLVDGDEVIEKVKGQWLPAHGGAPQSGLASQMTRGADPPAGMEAWSNVAPEGVAKAGEGEPGSDGPAGGQLQALQRLQQQLLLADAAAASAAASAGGSAHGGTALPLIRSPSMSGPNAGRDPAEVLMAQVRGGREKNSKMIVLSTTHMGSSQHTLEKKTLDCREREPAGFQ